MAHQPRRLDHPSRIVLVTLLVMLALLSATLPAVSTTAQSSNPIVNPGFETGNANGWLHGGSSHGVNTTSPHSGSYAAYNNGAWNSIFQNVSVQANTSYTLTAWARLATAASGNNQSIYISTNGGSTRQRVFITSTSYTQYSITFSTGSSTTVQIGNEEINGSSSIAYIDDFVLSAASSPTPTATPTPAPGGTGLRGEYFNNTTLTAPAALTRTDAQVNFDWASGSPATGVTADNFSVRWTGQVEAPVSGAYTFATTSDDGVRLWVNGQQLVTNWTDHGPTTDSGPAITLTAGQKYSVTMEYYERGGGAVARLLWSYPGQAQQAIPQSRLFPADAASGAVTRIRFYPRSGYASRMLNGRFTGSNESATNGFVELVRIGTTPAENTWTELTLSNSAIYRYVKYESPAGGWGNVAEIEFYSGTTKLSGTGFGTAGSNNNSGNTFDKALDGNTSTFFDAASADNQYVGIDRGLASQVAAPSFSPAPGTYSSAQSVSLSSSSSGASIRYTTDGTAPSSSSGTLYSGPISVSASTTIRAIAYKSGLADSTISSGSYTISAVPTPTPAPGSASRIYHIGNSVTDTINYSAFRSMAQSGGKTYNFGRHMIPGASLDWIWDHPGDGFNESPYGYYPNALPNYSWDVVTIQPFDRHLDSDTSYARRYIDLARQRADNANTQFYVYSRWPRKNSDGTLDYDAKWLRTYTGGWDGSEESKDYFEDLTNSLRGQTTYLSKPVRMVPAGDVMYELNQRMKAGRIPGFSNVTQLYADGIHLDNVGSFVVATTFYATMYKADPRGLSYASYDVIKNSATDHDITDSLASAIQQCVWDVVSTHPYAGLR
jgi:hypothetical protein